MSGFKRSVCFMFFENYLKGADRISDQFGIEVGYKYLTGIIRYALYQEKSDDDTINALLAPLIDTIDEKQEKRKQYFNREHANMEEVIIRYNQKYPDIIKK